jgi:hypothetical protein
MARRVVLLGTGSTSETDAVKAGAALTAKLLISGETALFLDAAGVATPNFVHIASDFIIACVPSVEGTLLGDKAVSAVFDNATLRRLVPGFAARFHAHYEFLAGVTANATWCTPLSSIEHDSKWDWLVYTAALDYTNTSTPSPSAWSTRVFEQLYAFANTTSSRFPLSDHPSCIGAAPPAAAADRARPVLGAFFAPLLVAQPSEAVLGQWRAIRAASESWWQE